jgi:hypothetical protein
MYEVLAARNEHSNSNLTSRHTGANRQVAVRPALPIKCTLLSSRASIFYPHAHAPTPHILKASDRSMGTSTIAYFSGFVRNQVRACKNIANTVRAHRIGDRANASTATYATCGLTGDCQPSDAAIKAIRLHREALDTRPPGHCERAQSCTDLAVSLLRLWYHTGDCALLEEAVMLQREVLELRPRGHSDRVCACANLALSLRRKLQEDLCDQTGLQTAITHRQKARCARVLSNRLIRSFMILRDHNGHANNSPRETCTLPTRSSTKLSTHKNAAMPLCTAYGQRKANGSIKCRRNTLDLRHSSPTQGVTRTDLRTGVSSACPKYSDRVLLHEACRLITITWSIQPLEDPRRCRQCFVLLVDLALLDDHKSIDSEHVHEATGSSIHSDVDVVASRALVTCSSRRADVSPSVSCLRPLPSFTFDAALHFAHLSLESTSTSILTWVHSRTSAVASPMRTTCIAISPRFEVYLRAMSSLCTIRTQPVLGSSRRSVRYKTRT